MQLKITLYLFITFLILTIPFSSLAVEKIDSQVISNKVSTSSSQIQSATHADGGMVLAYPNKKQTGVKLHQYNPLLNQWEEATVLKNEPVAQATSEEITNLNVKPLRIYPKRKYYTNYSKYGYIVYWVSKYYNNDTFLEARYNIYRIKGFKDKSYAGQITKEEAINDKSINENAYLDVIPDVEFGSYFTIGIIWSEDNQLYARQWDSQKYKWSYNDQYYLTDNLSADNLFTANLSYWEMDEELEDYYESCNYIFFSNSGNVYGQYIGNSWDCWDYDDELVVIEKDSTLLDVTTDADKDEIYILYQKNDNIYLDTFDSTEWASTETVFTMENSVELTKENVRVSYDENKQQYILVTRESHDNQYDYNVTTKRKSSWSDKTLLFSSKKEYALPQIRNFESGNISLIWKKNKKWYRKKYIYQNKTWTVNKKIKKKYNNVKLVSPFALAAVKSKQQDKYIESLHKQNNPAVKYLRIWNMHNNLTGKKVRLPNGYSRIFHERKGKYHFIVLKKKSKLISVIKTEKELFN